MSNVKKSKERYRKIDIRFVIRDQHYLIGQSFTQIEGPPFPISCKLADHDLNENLFSLEIKVNTSAQDSSTSSLEMLSFFLVTQSSQVHKCTTIFWSFNFAADARHSLSKHILHVRHHHPLPNPLSPYAYHLHRKVLSTLCFLKASFRHEFSHFFFVCCR